MVKQEMTIATPVGKKGKKGVKRKRDDDGLLDEDQQRWLERHYALEFKGGQPSFHYDLPPLGSSSGIPSPVYLVAHSTKTNLLLNSELFIQGCSYGNEGDFYEIEVIILI